MKRALVLGGGGVTGIAWMTGLLHGLEDLGLHLREADRFVGTSAGSAVAAQIAGSTPLAELDRRQCEGDVEEIPGALGLAGTVRLVAAMTLRLDKRAGLRRLGRAAVRDSDPALAGPRRAVIARRLPEHAWPERDLRITAVDVDSGNLQVFERASGVDLVDAVAASCAVPSVWPVVEIGGHGYMDGGMWSATNLELARGCETVLVLAPEPFGVRRALGRLGPGVRAAVVGPDPEARAARGTNSLDPAARRPSAEAGAAQAARVARDVRTLWEG